MPHGCKNDKQWMCHSDTGPRLPRIASQRGLGSHLAHAQAACLRGEALQELGQAQGVWGMTTESAMVLRATPQIDGTLCPQMQALSQTTSMRAAIPLPSQKIQTEGAVPIHSPG